MNILLTSIGTRGDMEPFLAIGQLLQEKGHTISCLFPEQFRTIVEDCGFTFESLGPEFIQMLESDLGKFALGGSAPAFMKIPAFIKLASIQNRNNKTMVKKQYEVIKALKPDKVIHNGKVMYPVIWEISNPGKTVYISPVPFLHYVKGHTHIAFHSNYGDVLNKLTFKLADWGTVKAIIRAGKGLGLKDVRKNLVMGVMKNHKVIYTISPQLFNRPDYWPANRKVLGYHERDKTTHWEPDTGLLEFLQRHDKLVFVTFGSMTNPNPKGKTQLFLDIFHKHNIAAIINTSSGGLVQPDNYNTELFHFVSNIPYDWIFNKIYAVIHHGGSGTTHMVAKYGCASLIIPHVIDQFAFNEILFKKGLGPKGIKIGKITMTNLEPLILDLVTKDSYKINALEISKKMKDEELLKEKLYRHLIN